ncbi:MAG: hypothetical protein IT456_08650 [Planctomycetes bacterium]|jgi:hypothetical protein|nr:hypothetical protein [Planctomycetota bacterium]
MSTSERTAPVDWLRAFLPLGTLRGDSWRPLGAGVLLVDMPVVWLITAASVVDQFAQDPAMAWVPHRDGSGLLNLSRVHQQFGLAWIRHASLDLAATLLPVDANFDIRAFSAAQCTRLADLQPLQPVVTVGALYGGEFANSPAPAPAVHDGIISRKDPQSQRLFTTAPLLPRNVGAPLLLASPYGGTVTLAGICLGNVLIGEVDPRTMPVRLGVAIGVDAALELIRSDAAAGQRLAASRSSSTNQPPTGANS